MQLSRQALQQAQERLVFGRRKALCRLNCTRSGPAKLSEAVASDLGVQASIAEAAERAHFAETSLRDIPNVMSLEIRNADNPQLQESSNPLPNCNLSGRS
jgi:hypothetical protein